VDLERRAGELRAVLGDGVASGVVSIKTCLHTGRFWGVAESLVDVWTCDRRGRREYHDGEVPLWVTCG
jgi:hypothetical protein